MAIKRLWHGYTRHEHADAYLELLRREIIPGIEAKKIPGYRGFELMRRNHPEEVEFITLMSFDSLDNVIAFQGEDYERSYVPDAAQELLARWDETASHYEMLPTR